MFKLFLGKTLMSFMPVGAVIPLVILPITNLMAVDEIHTCVGAVGPECLPINMLTGEGDVSVGSILHDNCCIVNFPNGHWCNNGGEDQEICRDTWDKAVQNTLAGHTWKATFSRNPDNTKIVSGRKAEPRYYYETVATATLKAPRGTQLERTDAEFCASKQFQETQQQLSSQNFGTCQ
ncbi:hypothetical protein IQ266_22730 [filamentous cyanobacterium LEGE 11480]|uniref:Uncharacterized protein n=1 Tax=Romeriopsis navalis LEGE 11480 TaxID=2777977 RepID=A0A928VU37_9CYAN|nr:hypothetical protein [Romeriopsis navalis]MBE9032557.1 hypothetical protein [Romeriopsis navalis LEGE 11480]